MALTAAEREFAIMNGESFLEAENWSSKNIYNKGQQGVFALNPLMTPKYAKNDGSQGDNEFKESLARMYLSLADASDQTKKAFMASIPNDDRVRALAQVLALSNTGFIDFFLQQINETYNEALQVDKVLGDNYVAFFFGQEPPMFQYAGSLINSMQDDQRTGFGLAYQHLLRGSQLAKRGGLVRLRYDSTIVSGVLTATNQTMHAENELIVPFQFTLLVKEVVWLQPKKGTKLSATDFVKLSTAFDEQNALGKVGRAQDVRVRTTMNGPLEDPFAVDEEAETVATQEQVYSASDTPALQRLNSSPFVYGTIDPLGLILPSIPGVPLL